MFFQAVAGSQDMSPVFHAFLACYRVRLSATSGDMRTKLKGSTGNVTKFDRAVRTLCSSLVWVIHSSLLHFLQRPQPLAPPSTGILAVLQLEKGPQKKKPYRSL